MAFLATMETVRFMSEFIGYQSNIIGTGFGILSMGLFHDSGNEFVGIRK
jgi:hypothetical protein